MSPHIICHPEKIQRKNDINPESLNSWDIAILKDINFIKFLYQLISQLQSPEVLDLQDNFPRGGFGTSEMGPPPPEVIEENWLKPRGSPWVDAWLPWFLEMKDD